MATLSEYTSPLLAEPGHMQRITDLLLEREAEAPEHVAFQIPLGLKEDGSRDWADVTTRAFFDRARLLAKALIASGVKPGDAVAIMGHTCIEWVLADVASLLAGAVVVPIYDTSSPAQIRTIALDAGVVHAFAGAQEQIEELAQVLGSPEKVWSFTRLEGVNARDIDQVSASDSGTVSDEQLEKARTSRSLDDVATIVYTSGTTSAPKGVLLTHGNFVSQLMNIAFSHGTVLNERGSTILFLPLSHVLARAVQLICLYRGMRIAHLSDTSKVIPTFAEVKPTFVMVVPRVLDKIINAVGQKAEAKKLGRVWKSALATAREVGELRESTHEFSMPRLPLGLKLKHAVFDTLFYSKIRELLGGNMMYVLCGGAKLHRDTALAFRGFSIPIIEGYGLTETTAPIAANLPGDLRAGSVGLPVPGTTIRITDEGEVLAKGPGVSPGYRNPEHTKLAYVDGFVRTGDLGRLDDNGRLTLNGRSKDVIVTSGGKTIEPAGWEGAVEQHPSVAYAVAVGDDRPYLTALLIQQTEDGEEASEEIEIIENPKLIADILPYLENANQDVSRTERIKKFALVKANLSDPHLITPSLKLKRQAFLEKAKSAIEEMYEKAPSGRFHELIHRDHEPRKKDD